MNISKINIRLATVQDKQRWDDYISNQSNALPYHFYGWKEAVERAYGFECPYFIALDNRNIRGVFPLAHIRSPFHKGSLVSLPYCDSGGIFTDTNDCAALLLEHVLSYANDNRIKAVELRNIKQPPYLSRGEICSSEKVRMLLKLPEKSDVLLAGFKSKLRSQIRKPIKEGLKVKVGDVELLNDFYKVMVNNMRDLGSPVHSKQWFKLILLSYGKRSKCCVVYMPDGEPAAAGLILSHTRIVSVPWASSIRRLNRWNPNMLLYWTFLKYAADNSFELFDFGRSTINEGTYRFKEQWGAKPSPLYWHYLSANGSPIPNINMKKNQFGRAIHYWKRLPVPVTKKIGPMIRKYISL